MIATTVHDGIAVVVFDTAGEKVNVVSESFLGELKAELERAGADPAVRGIVLGSAKPDCFLAGADLKAMRALQTDPAAGTRGEAVSRMGHAFMNWLEAFPKPVVAAVGGVCLGGGTELVLACRYRVASDADSTRIGLPEVKLGILPGWGGTVRCPELVGVPAALDLMMTGKELDGRRAARIGLVDDVAPAAVLHRAAAVFLARTLKDGGARVAARRRAIRGLVGRWLVDAFPPGRVLVCAMARRQARARTDGVYPSPLRIADLVSAQALGGRAAAFDREAKALGELISGPVARNLLGLFFLTQDAKSAGPKAAPRPVRRVGVVGGGLMGSGIATVFANRLLPVRLKDVGVAEAAKSVKSAADHFREQMKRRRLTPLAARDRLDAVSGGATWEGFGTADLVVEAVPEMLDLKRKVFADLEAVVRPDAVLASNTSTLPIGQIAAGLAHPERVAGMHFFFPAVRMPLVEVIPHAGTDPAVTAAVLDVARRCGKTAILVKDAPGFLVNRILLPYMAEAYFLLTEGNSVAAVDGAALAYGMPMGPIRLAGEVGLAVAHKAGQVIFDAFQDRLEAPPLEEAMTKTPGLYAVRGREKLPNAPAIEALARAQGRPVRPASPAEIQDRLILSMVNEAAWCLADGIVESPGLLDLSLILGIGFPPHRGGLLRDADRRGAGEIAGRLEELAGRCGRRFAPAPMLGSLAGSGGRFFPA